MRLKTKKPPKVVIGIPTYKSVPSMSYLTGMATVVDCGVSGIMATVAGKLDMYITTARNELCQYAIELYQQGLATHLFQMDDDMVIPDGTVQALLARDVPVVSGAYWGKTLMPIAYDLRPKDGKPGPVCRFWPVFPKSGLRRVDGLGAGCLLIDISVLVKMAKRYKDERWFQNSDTDEYLGEDVFFFRRLKEMGIPAYVDCDAPCDHMAQIAIGRTLVEGNLKVEIEAITTARARHADKIAELSKTRNVACRLGCSHCCRRQVLVVDLIDGVVIYEYLRQRGLWTRELRAKLTGSPGPSCVFLNRDACSIYPVRPVACSSYFGTNPPRCGSKGLVLTTQDPDHSKAAANIYKRLLLTTDLYKLSGAILTAEAILSGEPMPDVWHQQRPAK